MTEVRKASHREFTTGFYYNKPTNEDQNYLTSAYTRDYSFIGKVLSYDHDELRKRTISAARAAVKQVEVDERRELSDDDVVAILTKQVKMRKDALPDFEKAGRTDLADAYKAEIGVLSEYLPEQLSEEDITKIVKEAAADLGIDSGKNNMGKLMKQYSAYYLDLGDLKSESFLADE